MGAELFHAEGRTERQTDGHDEANSRFSKFRERAWLCLLNNCLYFCNIFLRPMKNGKFVVKSCLLKYVITSSHFIIFYPIL